jgi:hypothetical protein
MARQADVERVEVTADAEEPKSMYALGYEAGLHHAAGGDEGAKNEASVRQAIGGRGGWGVEAQLGYDDALREDLQSRR